MNGLLKIFSTTALLILLSLLGHMPIVMGDDAGNSKLLVLSYHDIQNNPATDRVDTAVTLSTASLIQQFEWLREHEYRVVSLDDIIKSKQSGKSLPSKSVLLSFDDGYLSAYTHVLPLLKLFSYTAIVAPVVKWTESQPDEMIRYGKNKLSRRNFLTWPQIKAMMESGLVEIASHSHDMHYGITGNPQGNTQAAAVTRLYDKTNKQYESEQAYLARVRNDLSQSFNLIRERTGQAPRALVWPYGRYNQDLINIADELGMPVTLTLDDGLNNGLKLNALKRLYIYDSMPLSDFVSEIQRMEKPPTRPAVIRAAHIDLDYIYDPDPQQTEKNLGQVLDRIKALRINTVYLQAFADPDGDGSTDALYFPNRHLPVRADLFNRVAWQLITRSEVAIYAWLPTLGFQLPDGHPAATEIVTSIDPENNPSTQHRLSPFSPIARRTIIEIYEDLAKYSHIDGLLFHDDAYLNDYEDASQAAQGVYQVEWQLTDSIEDIRANPELLKQWSRNKTRWLIDWTNTLEKRVRHYRPRIKTARNIFARTILRPESENWFAQNFNEFIKHYDYTAIMAMPYMENAKAPDTWLQQLTKRVASQPGALDKTVFELQTRDWRDQQLIDTTTLARQIRILKLLGVNNIAYYPDDFQTGHPDISVLKPAISLQSFPYKDPD